MPIRFVQKMTDINRPEDNTHTHTYTSVNFDKKCPGDILWKYLQHDMQLLLLLLLLHGGSMSV